MATEPSHPTRPLLRIDVLTLFPEIFDSYLGQSLLKLAIQRGLVQVTAWDFRRWTADKHGKVDDRPYGGGPGMVIACQPVFDAVQAVQAEDEPGELMMLTPTGDRLRQPLVEELAGKRRLLLLCGRYEGFDERIRLGLKPREISIGDFICNGGEVPAMVLIDSVIRLVPGVLGHEESAADDSFSQADDAEWIEFPQYTRPPVYEGMEVPPILLSGHHEAIRRWRAEQAEQRKRDRQRRQEQQASPTLADTACSQGSPTET